MGWFTIEDLKLPEQQQQFQQQIQQHQQLSKPQPQQIQQQSAVAAVDHSAGQAGAPPSTEQVTFSMTSAITAGVGMSNGAGVHSPLAPNPNTQPQVANPMLQPHTSQSVQFQAPTHSSQPMILHTTAHGVNGHLHQGALVEVARLIGTGSKIPNDVEFLITSGKVFARHRNTLEPFDPFRLPKPSTQAPTNHQNALAVPRPPVPLTARQIEEVLKLLGPEICLALPWLRLPFNPQHVFAKYSPSVQDAAARDRIDNEGTPAEIMAELTRLQQAKALGPLVAHQKEASGFLSRSPEMNNPVVYSNAYRRAPPELLVKKHQGPSFFESSGLPDLNNYPTKTASLSVPILDLTVSFGSSVRTQYLDPVKSLRDKITGLELSLYTACLLDERWGVLHGSGDPIDPRGWKKKVENCSTIRGLSCLLVTLVDACSLKAFVPQWYTTKENSGNQSGSGRESPVDGDSTESPIAISDDWSADYELTRRKWERCRGNETLRLFDGFLESVFKRYANSNKKRGKARYGSKALLDGGLKRARNAYEFFREAEHPKILAEMPNIKFTERAHVLGERWRALTAEEKKKYEDLARIEKQKFNEQWDLGGVGVEGIPKRARNAYEFFAKAERTKISAEMPNIKLAEFGHVLGERWRALAAEEKKKYEELADIDKQRFSEEMAEFNIKLKSTTAETRSPDDSSGDAVAATKQQPSDSARKLSNNENDLSAMNCSSTIYSQSTKYLGTAPPSQHSSADTVQAVAGKPSLSNSNASPSNGTEQNSAALFNPNPAKSESVESRNAVITPSASSSPETAVVLSPIRRKGCGQCDICLQEDCRECTHCLDMPKYGGPNRLRQRCMRRKKCPMIVASTPAKATQTPGATKTKSSKKKKQRAKRESLAPPSSRRRSDRLHIIRNQVESLLGISDEGLSNTEKAIYELKLDQLEKILTDDDTTAGYWAIAGRCLARLQYLSFLHAHIFSDDIPSCPTSFRK